MLGPNDYKWIVITWNSFIAFISVVGNVIVLVSSLKYNAIHLDRVLIALIRNLAATDLGFGLMILPKTVNAAMGRNVWGCNFCRFNTLMSFIFAGVGSTFLAGLNINKLTVLIFPIRSNAQSYERGKIISCVVWALPTAIIIAGVTYAHFSALKYVAEFNMHTFDYQVNDPDILSKQILEIAYRISFTLIPMLCVIATTIWMGGLMRKVSGIQKQTVRTLLVISVTFCFSLIPSTVISATSAALGSELHRTKKWFQILKIISPLAFSTY